MRVWPPGRGSLSKSVTFAPLLNNMPASKINFQKDCDFRTDGTPLSGFFSVDQSHHDLLARNAGLAMSNAGRTVSNHRKTK